MKNQLKSLGICFGSATIKIVELLIKENNIEIGKKIIRNHEKKPFETFIELMDLININEYNYVAITGRMFKDKINIRSISEPEAVESALDFLKSNDKIRKVKAIASLGAENFIVYKLDENDKIHKIETGNKCASGTGEFFLQQIDRLNLSINKAVDLAVTSDPHKISGRCSVYCKSDCTHALNTGVPIGNVVAGLCRMLGDKILTLLEKTGKTDIMLIGQVSKNSAVTKYLNEQIKNLIIPEESDIFEALGAAYYALVKKVWNTIDKNSLFKSKKSSFSLLPAINNNNGLVKFKSFQNGIPENGDECIIGLDVGSTTTKAVILRINDNAVLASVYLRTNGDPVNASRECYRELDNQINKNLIITGLGITGSGRMISSIHALTDGMVNEIIAHATGASFFDAQIDTIFEIGGQDAKYIHLENGVPIDYAMNEACSAGTGSFLEEALKNNFSIGYKDIEKTAILSKNPPNFNDQCSAFINSDIKTAIQENISSEDIVAGVVYSICINYLNKVKAQRKIGKKIFMQGGVSYNQAVPIAMANLLQKEIIVPPEPGLIGAFGVALEIKGRIEKGLMTKKSFSLKELYERKISYGKSFICSGDSSGCDRKCRINMLAILDKTYPFGGACNKYYNQIHHLKYDDTRYDLVQERNNLLYKKYAEPHDKAGAKKIGMMKSFFTGSLYPLFFNFFDKLGYNVVLSDEIDADGIKNTNASFCYPAEISHGYFQNLLKKEVDWIFLPKITEFYVENSRSYEKEHQCTCLIAQSESYVLKSAFKGMIGNKKLISPTINFSQGFGTQLEIFINIAAALGKSIKEAAEAYKYGLEKLKAFNTELKERGHTLLSDLERTGKTGIVLFGRPYNAFADDINLNIPKKFASRGYYMIPWDMLPIEDEHCDKDMCWAFGQNIMKASEYIRKNKNLYGAYITNFGCGPDSFLIGYFRDLMMTKPSLTLEIDSHTADAGINTRIEAFLDIIDRYKKVMTETIEVKNEFKPAQLFFENGNPYYVDSDSKKTSLFDKSVTLLIPSIGEYASDILASAFKSVGINAVALPVYDTEDLRLGRENTIGKECLPMILVVGGLLKYLKNRKSDNEKIAYFMPSNPGNCRFTQYSVFINSLIEKKQIRNVSLLSLSPENSYAGIPIQGMLCFLKGVIISDLMEDIKNALKAIALDRQSALKIMENEWVKIRESVAALGGKNLYSLLKKVAARLKKIPLKISLKDAKKIFLVGDFFARRDDFCCQGLIEKFADKEIIVKREHIFSWFNYVDYLVTNNIIATKFNLMGRIEFSLKKMLQKHYEKKVKKILSKTGLYNYQMTGTKKILKYSKQYFDRIYTGEQVLVLGNFFNDILTSSHGVVSIGPFACMPMKVVESILTKESTLDTKIQLENNNKKLLKKFPTVKNLPFLPIESDGNPFPQIIEAKIEAFCVQVDRLFNETKKKRKDKNNTTEKYSELEKL